MSLSQAKPNVIFIRLISGHFLRMAKRCCRLMSLCLLLLLTGCSQSVAGRSAVQSPQSSIPDLTERVPIETVPDSQANAVERKREQALHSTLNVRLLDGTIELSQSELGAGQIDFNVLNEATEPLYIQVIKTELAPDKVMIKAGQVDRTQSGVEVLSQVRDRPINPSTQELISETLSPGEYKIVITSTRQTKPVAHTTLTLFHEV